ncbi:DNA polymerase III subunit gamma and tau [Gulosibacter chungangensis]|uniref:DNA-directed DNA polymerase n=1 Tax=Gulosibacter chungangensis TaxID=979746 RepID=A0A7J5BIP5_9MICO|nr:DNA polymerase III subunit gamma and tau [Gulosibacter chungangensis]
MVAALYRRYRPESFAEMIGQRQVTDPLVTALRTGRVNHAYLFSGPRGCGKTSSARILARCLNCEEGPTPEPCGKCPSCLELGRDGGGSIDVFEIDAASHGGVDDARELRERAVVAPTRDRFKIFIIDEAHMVTSAGFNALLKVVEEPPENVMFIFATTEPEKVIGTIRSRTHHFPFRLIPPAPMLEYVEEICAAEGVTAQPGVLPLVVRAGGGSARDTMSLLDQLIAGTDGTELQYELATQLLGFTSQGLLNDAIDAFAGGDAASAYRSVDAVIQSGQDPRRYVEDLLERVRDLIVVRALGESARSVLRGVAPDDLEQMRGAAGRFSPRALSQMADIVNETLTEMSGVTAPRVQLELMVARILVAMRADFAGDAAGFAVASSAAPAASPAARPANATAAPSPAQAPTPRQQEQPRPAASAQAQPVEPEVRNPAAAAAAAWDAVAPAQSPVTETQQPATERQESTQEPAAQQRTSQTPSQSVASQGSEQSKATQTPTDPAPTQESARPTATASGVTPQSAPAGTSGPSAAEPRQDVDEPVSDQSQARAQAPSTGPADPTSFDLARVRAAWPEVLEQIARDGHGTSAAIVKMLSPLEYGPGDGVGNLRVEVPNRGVMEQLARGREQQNAPANHLKTALTKVFGFEVLIHPRVLKPGEPSAVPPQDAQPADPDRHRGAVAERSEINRSTTNEAQGHASAPSATEAAHGTVPSYEATSSASSDLPPATAVIASDAAAQPPAASPAPQQSASSAASQQPAPKPEPTSPAPEAKVATWDVVAIPGSEDGPGSGWDALATDSSEPTTAGAAVEERVVEVIAAKEAAAMEPEPRQETRDATTGQRPPAPASASEPVPASEPAPSRRHPALAGGTERYGESVIRERLGARFVGEELIELAPLGAESLDPADIPPPDDFDAPPPPEEY